LTLILSKTINPAAAGTGALIACISVVFSFVNIIGWAVWCFRICLARDKSPWIGLFVLFPPTYPPALAYLAFSK
jgi:hypothetical protein